MHDARVLDGGKGLQGWLNRRIILHVAPYEAEVETIGVVKRTEHILGGVEE